MHEKKYTIIMESQKFKQISEIKELIGTTQNTIYNYLILKQIISYYNNSKKFIAEVCKFNFNPNYQKEVKKVRIGVNSFINEQIDKIYGQIFLKKNETIIFKENVIYIMLKKSINEIFPDLKPQKGGGIFDEELIEDLAYDNSVDKEVGKKAEESIGRKVIRRISEETAVPLKNIIDGILMEYLLNNEGGYKLLEEIENKE